jgi:RNA polymerase sigma-70 factor (ECF subfamily)
MEQGQALFVASFSEFYSLNYDTIAKALSIHFGDTEIGREATDEAMTRAYDRWGTVSGHNNPAGWVYRVGLNWGRSWYRKANRSLPWVEREPINLPTATDPALQQALAALDEKQRAVVVLRYLLDWSTEQTADALDIAPGTVKSRLHKGLGELRRQLDNPYVEPPDPPPSTGTKRRTARTNRASRHLRSVPTEPSTNSPSTQPGSDR